MDRQNIKRKMRGGIVGFIGFLLSPLSWWNDAVVNLPIAFVFGWLVSLIYAPAFETALIVAYWLTNLAGLILLHHGARDVVTNKRSGNVGKELVIDLVVSLGYTLLILALIHWGMIKPVVHW